MDHEEVQVEVGTDGHGLRRVREGDRDARTLPRDQSGRVAQTRGLGLQLVDAVVDDPAAEPLDLVGQVTTRRWSSSYSSDSASTSDARSV